MLKVRTLFSGIGSPESALRNLGVEFELVDFCEIDKYAVKSYCAIHGVDESKNLGDISKVWGRDLPYADLLVWGFPCTDISVAGKQKGIIEGETRSGLYYEGLRILKETMPKYSIIENVKNLTGKQFKAEFSQMLEDIEQLGYANYWKVLNAKDYGIPQNRERVFIVSIRKDVDTGDFKFPEGFDNGLRLKDMLEDEVDEKFYISNEKVEKIINSNFAQEKAMIQGKPFISAAINKIIEKNNGEIPEAWDLYNKNPIINGISKTLSCDCGHTGTAGATAVTTDYRIRKLTPKECFRLMGLSDEEFQRCVDAGVSNSQLYKQAGNSIVTKVLEAMFKVLLAEEMKAKLKVI